MSRNALFFVAVCACACTQRITPDPTGGHGGSTSSSAVSGATTTAATTSASSSTGSTKPGDYSAGSRLKVRALKADDGSTQQLGFYDSMLGVNCVFRNAADMRLRCLPDVEVATSTYADAQCTQPALVTTCGSQPKYIVQEAGVCATTAEWLVFPVGPSLVTQYYVKTPQGACNATPVLAGLAVWTAGTGMSPSMFVGADEAVQ